MGSNNFQVTYIINFLSIFFIVQYCIILSRENHKFNLLPEAMA